MDYNKETLKGLGFEGFVSVSDLKRQFGMIPSVPGVYYVLRYSAQKPSFLDENIGGHFKGRNPTVSTKILSEAWTDDCPLLYIGKANDLNDRLKALLRFADGKPVGHWGGRYLWQVSDSDTFTVCWRRTLEEPRKVESMLLEEFRKEYGKLPFANISGPEKNIDQYYKELHDNFYTV